jgi:hypothetical protein
MAQNGPSTRRLTPSPMRLQIATETRMKKKDKWKIKDSREGQKKAEQSCARRRQLWC